MKEQGGGDNYETPGRKAEAPAPRQLSREQRRLMPKSGESVLEWRTSEGLRHAIRISARTISPAFAHVRVPGSLSAHGPTPPDCPRARPEGLVPGSAERIHR